MLPLVVPAQPARRRECERAVYAYIRPRVCVCEFNAVLKLPILLSRVSSHVDGERALLCCGEPAIVAPQVSVAVDPRVHTERVAARIRLAANLTHVRPVCRVLASHVQQELVLACEGFLALPALKWPLQRMSVH